MTLQTFRELEKEISAGVVCRVHKSFMVSLDKIESIERDRIKIRDTFIPVKVHTGKCFYDLIDHPAK